MVDSQARFDALASTWDNVKYRTDHAAVVASFMVYKKWISERSEVMEFGCGTGLLTFELLKQGQKFQRIDGVDNSKGMVEQFNVESKKKGVESFCHGRLEDVLTVKDVRKYDVIYSLKVYHHVPDCNAVTQALLRRLKLGGILVIADFEATPNAEHFHSPGVLPVERHGLTEKEARQWCSSEGSTNVDVVRLPITKPVDKAWGGAVEDFTMLVISCRQSKSQL